MDMDVHVTIRPIPTDDLPPKTLIGHVVTVGGRMAQMFLAEDWAGASFSMEEQQAFVQDNVARQAGILLGQIIRENWLPPFDDGR